MRCNYLQLSPLIQRVANVPGAFAEIGVFYGVSFVPMAVNHLHRTCYAVDSFEGMAEPGAHDGNRYRKGSLNSHGSDFLRGASPNIKVHQGWVPEVLATIPAHEQFAFVHVDLDHYLPTLAAMRWAWQRLSPGGLLVTHDWFPDRNEMASLAIKEFVAENNITVVESIARHAVIRFPEKNPSA